jgi:excisionase family DNA binding protein
VTTPPTVTAPLENARGVPRLALTPAEAAEALGVSEDFFADHVRPELRLVRRGRKVLVSVRELDRWLEASSARTLEA